MKPILQAEVAECGFCCLAMVLNSHGKWIELRDICKQFGGAASGAKLRTLVECARFFGLAGRAVKVPIGQVINLKLPCILHWDLNHFVVLQKVARSYVIVLDPAVGKRRLPLDEFAKHFTGVALELTPTAEFSPQTASQRVGLNALTGKVAGLWRSLFQVFALAVVLELFAIAAPLLQQMVVDDVLTAGDRELLTIVVLGFGLLLIV